MSTLPFQKLDVYQVAKRMSELVHEAKIRNGELRDQAERASLSVVLNLVEGLPNDAPKLRSVYFTRARNSLMETAGAIDLAKSLRAMHGETADEVLELAGRVRAMLIGLMRPKRA